MADCMTEQLQGVTDYLNAKYHCGESQIGGLVLVIISTAQKHRITSGGTALSW